MASANSCSCRHCSAGLAATSAFFHSPDAGKRRSLRKGLHSSYITGPITIFDWFPCHLTTSDSAISRAWLRSSASSFHCASGTCARGTTGRRHMSDAPTRRRPATGTQMRCRPSGRSRSVVLADALLCSPRLNVEREEPSVRRHVKRGHVVPFEPPRGRYVVLNLVRGVSTSRDVWPGDDALHRQDLVRARRGENTPQQRLDALSRGVRAVEGECLRRSEEASGSSARGGARRESEAGRKGGGATRGAPSEPPERRSQTRSSPRWNSEGRTPPAAQPPSASAPASAREGRGSSAGG